MERKHEYYGTCIGFLIDGDKDLRTGNFARNDIRYSDPYKMTIKYRIQFKGETDYTDVDENTIMSYMLGYYSVIWKIDNLRISNKHRIKPASGKVIPYIRFDGKEYCRLLTDCYMYEFIRDENIKYVLSVTGHGQFINLRKSGYKVICDSLDRFSLRLIMLRKGNVVYILFDCDRVYLDHEFTFSQCKAAGLSFSKYIDTSNLSSFYGMFQDVQVGYFDLSGLNTSNAEKMEYMFSGSRVLKFKFGGLFNTSKVKDMRGMFSDLNDRGVGRWKSSIDVSKFDVSSVRLMSNMFGDCNARISGLQYWDTHNVIDMEGMFHNSYIVSGEKLIEWDVSNVRDFSRMFTGTRASVLDISNWQIRLPEAELYWINKHLGDNNEKLMHYITADSQCTKIKLPSSYKLA